MTISIITATYNSAKTVKDTLDSILAQDYQDYECIIVDGLSKDNTIDIVKEYEPRFNGRMKWISEKDGGIYDAMNKGIAMATGDVIGILNSDDFYYDGTVLRRISSAFDDNDIDCVYGNLVYVEQNDTNRIVRNWYGSQWTPKAFLKGWHPAHPTFYCKKRCFETYGSFDTDFDVSADFELMLRFVEGNNIKNMWIDYIFVKMRMGGESSGSIRRIATGNKNILKAFKKNGFRRPPFYLVRRLFPKFVELLRNKLK